VDADAAERVAIDDEPECEGFERIDTGDVRYRIGALPSAARALPPSPWSSGVDYARWRPAEVAARAGEMIDLFRERGLPFTWAIGPNTDAPGLASILAARGLRREMDALILTATIPTRGRVRRHDLQLLEETDERTANAALRVDREHLGDELQDRVEARLAYLRCPSRRGGGVVAYRGRQAVGYGRWRFGSDGTTVYLHKAHTLQPHRHTGVYTAILAWRIEHAVEHGTTDAVVVAERSTSAPILMRLGFREVGSRQIWMSV
jgi:hypothetical protein